jgi:hypothetical protein
MAIRKDGFNQNTQSNEFFGIENRQRYWQHLLETKKLLFCEGCDFFIDYLVKQIIPRGETKRDETIHHEIYDVINAVENAISGVYRIQMDQIRINRN